MVLSRNLIRPKNLYLKKASKNYFLKTYVSSSEEAIKKYKKIYNLRSKIAHTEYLLTGDSFIVWAESEEDKSEELFILKLESIQFARVGLTNWMIKKSQPTT